MRLEPMNLYELEEHASRFISPHAWAFIDGGAQDEVTVKRNRAALEAITLRPALCRMCRTGTCPPPFWGRR